jgi:small subunit ribosomal protein S6e
MDLKLVLSTKDGKSVQKEVKTDALHGKRIGETVSGKDLGLEGYEFVITGGSDKCGFPMRKGIQEHRKLVLIGEGVGFCGKKRRLDKKHPRKKQKGLLRRRTVCGERITKIIRQVNLKVTKAGSAPLGEAPAQEKKEE